MMGKQFFVKITDFINKKESYYISCNEINGFGCIRINNKNVYYADIPEKYGHTMCLHKIRKSDYERLKKL